MGLHKRHTHGRVFRGLEAREHLLNHKRDSHGNTPKMNVPEGFEQKQVTDIGQSVVYVTLPQTFSGPAMYSTIASDPNAPQTSDAQTTNTDKGSSSQPTKTPSPSGASTTMATITSGAMTSSSIGGATAIVGSPLQATQSSTADTSTQQQSAGMTGGARAGLAIGIILAIAVGAGLIFFCWRKQKKAKSEEAEINNEKHGSFADAGARRFEAGAAGAAAAAAPRRNSAMTEKVPASLRSTRTTSTAPRLSLRPVTQFLPNLAENRKSGGNNLDIAGAGLVGQPKSSWERRPANGDQNPFDDASTLNENTRSRSNTPQMNPFDEPEGQVSTDSHRAAAAAAAAAAGGGAALAAARHSPKSSWEGSEPATPMSSQFRTAAAVPVGGPRTPPEGNPRGPNNVHRVQLDFKPSMDDELELRSGQLVRMLHEYDDGWVSLSSRNHKSYTPLTLPRHSAFAWTAASKASLHVPACRNCQSSHVLRDHHRTPALAPHKDKEVHAVHRPQMDRRPAQCTRVHSPQPREAARRRQPRRPARLRLRRVEWSLPGSRYRVKRYKPLRSISRRPVVFGPLSLR